MIVGIDLTSVERRRRIHRFMAGAVLAPFALLVSQVGVGRAEPEAPAPATATPATAAPATAAPAASAPALEPGASADTEITTEAYSDGHALLRCVEAPDGSLSGCKVISADSKIKGESALALAARRTIAPHLENGVAVRAVVNVPVRFVAVD
ncbi:MAG: energy transducer TonB [Caulobacterales bacterium]